MNAVAVRRPRIVSSEQTQPVLSVIEGQKASKKARPKVHYAILVLFTMGVILASQLVMSILLAQGEYEIAALKGDLREASRTVESLGEDIALLSSPQYLAASAAQLGMQPSSNVAFLKLSDGTVSGSLAVAGSHSAISEPIVSNTLLTQESSNLSAVLNLTQPAALEFDETPFALAPTEVGDEVTSSDANRGLAPVVDQ